MTMATDKETDAAASGSSAYQSWTLTSVMLRHKRASGGAIAFLLVLVALTVVTTVASPGREALSDSATCSEWGAATAAQKIAYARVYLKEYGPLANAAPDSDAVETVINNACIRASYLGEADDLSVIAGVRHAF
jgi:hypothetical protein